MNRWLWIWPILAVLVGVTALLYWGWSWITLALIVVVVVCPAIMFWDALKIHKPMPDDVKMDVQKSAGKR